MPALILSSIPPRNFELIRDQIGVILAAELQNQYTLNSSYPNVSTVWVERMIPFDSKKSLPTINVNVAKGTFDNKNRIKADCTTIYNIDVYTMATSAAGDPGDQKAMIQMQKILGLVWTILSQPEYDNLGFAKGKIAGTMVMDFKILEKAAVKDALSNVVGRLQFMVTAVESVNLQDVPVPITNFTDVVKLEDPVFGFVYMWSFDADVYADTAGDSFTLPVQYAHLDAGLVFDGAQTWLSNTITQSGTTVTVSGASFSVGQKLGVRLVLGDFTANVTVAADGSNFTIPSTYSTKQVAAVFDGAQCYIRNSGFTQSGTTITLLGGVSLAAGQQVTILYGPTVLQLTVNEGSLFTLPTQSKPFEVAYVLDGTQGYNSTQFTMNGLDGTMNDIAFSDGQLITIILR